MNSLNNTGSANQESFSIRSLELEERPPEAREEEHIGDMGGVTVRQVGNEETHSLIESAAHEQREYSSLPNLMQRGFEEQVDLSHTSISVVSEPEIIPLTPQELTQLRADLDLVQQNLNTIDSSSTEVPFREIENLSAQLLTLNNRAHGLLQGLVSHSTRADRARIAEDKISLNKIKKEIENIINEISKGKGPVSKEQSQQAKDIFQSAIGLLRQTADDLKRFPISSIPAENVEDAPMSSIPSAVVISSTHSSLSSLTDNSYGKPSMTRGEEIPRESEESVSSLSSQSHHEGIPSLRNSIAEFQEDADLEGAQEGSLNQEASAHLNEELVPPFQEEVENNTAVTDREGLDWHDIGENNNEEENGSIGSNVVELGSEASHNTPVTAQTEPSILSHQTDGEMSTINPEN